MAMKTTLLQKLYSLSVLVLLLFLGGCASIQYPRKADQKLAKLEELRASGQYVELRKSAEPLLKSWKQGDDGAQSKDLYHVQQMIASAYAGQGRFADLQAGLKKVYSEWKSTASQKDPAFVKALGRNALLLMEYDYLELAKPYLDEANQLFEGLSPNDKTIPLRMYLLQANAEYNLKAGFHLKADSLINTLLQAANQQVTVNETNKKSYLYKEANNILVEAQLLLLRNIASKGDNETLKAEVNKLMPAIKKTTGGSSRAIVQLNLLLARAAQIEDDNDRLTDYTKRAYKLCDNNKTYSAQHPLTSRLRYKMVEYLLNDSREYEATGYIIDIDKSLKQHYNDIPEYMGMKAIAYARLMAHRGQMIESWQNINYAYQNRNNTLIFSPTLQAEIFDVYAGVAIAIDSVRQAIAGYALTEMCIQQHFGNKAPKYIDVRLNNVFRQALFEGKWRYALQTYQLRWEKELKSQWHPNHPRYLKHLNNYGRIAQETDRFPTAEAALTEARNVATQKTGPYSLVTAEQLDNIANLKLTQGDYAAADSLGVIAAEICRQNSGKRSLTYINILRTQSRIAVAYGFPDEAKDYLKEAFRLENKVELEPILGYGSLRDDLPILDFLNNRFRQAEEGYLIQYAVYKSYGELGYQQLLRPLVGLSKVYLAMGDYAEADRAIREAMELSKQIYTDTSSKYTEAIGLQIEFATNIGDNEKALQYSELALDKYKRIFGNKHVLYAQALEAKALNIARLNPKDTKVEAMFKEAQKIYTDKFGTEHPLYAQSRKNIAQYYFSQPNKLGPAREALENAIKIWSAKTGRRGFQAGELHTLLGDVALQENRFPEAQKNYDQATNILKRYFNEEHPALVSLLSRKAMLFYQTSKEKEALELLEKVNKLQLKFIADFFPVLSEREKIIYWNNIQKDFELYYGLAHVAAKQKPSLTIDMYNLILQTKAALLSTAQRVRNSILRSPNIELRNKFQDYVRTRETLAGAMGQPDATLKEQGIDLGKLERDSDRLEKELSDLSEEFSLEQKRKNPSYKDVKASLKKGEMACELIRFRNFSNGKFSDSVHYLALLVGPESVNPEIVSIPYGKLLESRGIKYYRNSVRYKTEDLESYRLFWAPIAQKIPANTTLYYAPDGVYNQLNPLTFTSNGSTFVADQLNLMLVPSTREIITTPSQKGKSKAATTSNEKPSAVLLGNPNFFSTAATKAAGEKEGIQLEILQGTGLEIQAIEALLKNKGWGTQRLEGINATEEAIKKYQGPKLLHLATHGFFFDQENAEVGPAGVNQARQAQSSLLNAGIVLANGGDLLVEEGTSLNLKPGILTAYEAMTLNLDGTQLVVLSACETGLGHQFNGEGVYGLQRAFQVAGAKNLIMSLFKVDDTVTRSFMEIFYQNWLGGKNEREAFRTAQSEIRKKHKEPIYWGSFILSGI